MDVKFQFVYFIVFHQTVKYFKFLVENIVQGITKAIYINLSTSFFNVFRNSEI